MRYSEPLAAQIWVFLAFLGVGFLLGAVYLGFFFLRNLFQNGKTATAVCDLLFCLCAFAALFSAFLGFTNGVWRLPELAAAAAGFFAFRRTVGAPVSPAVRKAAALAARGVNRSARFVQTLSAALQTLVSRLRRQLRESFLNRRAQKAKRRAEKRAAREKKTEKNRKKRAKPLANPNEIHYNKY